MERRRKALGLRKQTSSKDIGLSDKEETPKKPEYKVNIASRRSEKKVVLPSNDKEGSNSRSESITSDQRTPKRHVQVIQPPGSPGLETVFPRMLGSPEIEVSWDWGCSQVPKDMLPSRLVKQGSPKQPSVVLSPLIQEPRVFQSRQMSEEENQERLAFYKNVLSQASKCKLEVDSTSENLDSLYNRAQPNLSTPKHSKKPLMQDRDMLNTLFDDSANEFMLECSQVVEEQLKSGQINIDAVVSSKIPNKKHNLSPDYSPEKVHKRVCPMKSRLNLFSETSRTSEENTENVQKQPLILRSPKRERLKNDSCSILQSDAISSNGKTNLNNGYNKISSVQKSESNLNNTSSSLSHIANEKKGVSNTTEVSKQPVKKLNCSALEGRPPNLKEQLTINNNSIKHNNTSQNKHGQQNVNNNKYDSVDKFRRSYNQVPQNVTRCLSTEANTTKKSTSTDDSKTTPKGLINNSQETNQKAADFTLLLDDGFDLELSSLDVDSICRNSQAPVAPKVCTKAEIEAKRRAALTRLKMKMKRAC